MTSTYIIAEAGVNHNGDPACAFKLVDAAIEAGADAVKFQTFKAGLLVVPGATKAHYQARSTGSQESQLEMLKRLELEYSVYQQLLLYCRERGIDFLSTAFDSDSLSFLVHDLGLKTLKLPSGEITNAPFLLEHAQTGCQLILSTGMATLEEVRTALAVIAYGLTQGRDGKPGPDAFELAFASEAGQTALRQRVRLLHCTSEYPAPIDQINLRAMDSLSEAFGLTVGYSDHSLGITVPIAAVARGAAVIEKHFTLDRGFEGPDHKASLEPHELTAMVSAIREVEKALGDGQKLPQDAELKNRDIARKSLVAKAVIDQGICFSADNLGVMRPGSGVSPMMYWSYIGKIASRSYQPGELIDE